MSRVFVDDGLLTWEVFATGGRYGLPEEPKVVFHCLAGGDHPTRFVRRSGDEADAEAHVHTATEDQLREMFRHSRPL